MLSKLEIEGGLAQLHKVHTPKKLQAILYLLINSRTL